MFDKLKNKWGVNGFRLFLILCTFAIGGSLSGRVAHYILNNVFEIENRAVSIVAYVLLITILWPVCVLLVSVLFGQFNFFKKYLARVGRRIFGRKNTNTRYSVAS